MKVLATLFTSNDGHFGVHRLTDKKAIIKSLENEISEIGRDWMDDYDVDLTMLKKATLSEFENMLSLICRRGHMEIKEL